jgi:hypothetical protein
VTDVNASSPAPAWLCRVDATTCRHTATVPPVAATELRSQFTAFKPAARRGPRPTESTNC